MGSVFFPQENSSRNVSFRRHVHRTRQELSEANPDDNARSNSTHSTTSPATADPDRPGLPILPAPPPPPAIILGGSGTTTGAPSPEPMFRNVTTSTKHILLVEPTSLRRNPYYFQIYYVYLNTIFASILPLALLLFFNINTAKELFKMSRLETRSLATTRASSMRMNNRRCTRVEFNPRGGKGSGDSSNDDVKAALEIAAKAHGLQEANLKPCHSSDPLLLQDHQSCACATQALPVITLTADDNVVCRSTNGGPIMPRSRENVIQVETSNFEEEPLSPASSDILSSRGEKAPTGRRLESRRSTITFLVQSEIVASNQPLSPGKRSESHPTFLEVDCNEGSSSAAAVNNLQATNIETVSANSGGSNNNVRMNSLDRGWTGLRLSARRRASSVWSANSTALRLSLTHALGSTRATSRRPTSFGLHPPSSSSPPFSASRRQSTSETKKELRLARISLCIVWLFLFCHVWKLVPTFYSTFLDDTNNKDEDKALGISVEWPDWLHVVENISHTLITLNSSLNFLIYIVL